MIVPMILLASLVTLVSCTKPVSETVVAPATTPDVKVEVVTPTLVPPTPVTPTPTPITPTPIQTATGAPVTTTPQPLTHKEVVSYNTPAGSDKIEFDVTVTDGVITAASATPMAENSISKMRQTSFASAVSVKVVGKKIANLQVDAIGGSSLTTAAFEQFIHSF